MSGRKPTVLYWLEVTTRGKLGYHQRGGGKYSMKAAMFFQQRVLRREGIESVAYVSEPIVWTELKEERP